MGKLEGRVAIVTGAAWGMGDAICLALAREGAHLTLAARNQARLEELAAEIRKQVPGCKTLTIGVDVTREDQVQAMARVTLEAFGRIDILVNAAGITGPIETPFWEITPEEWDAVLDTNLKGTWLCCKAVAPSMVAQKSGKIINIGGTSGLRGYKNRASYASSKWAVRGFTRTIALELGPHGVNANVVIPGVVDGPRMQKICAEKAKKWGWTPEQVYQKYCDEMALGRFVQEDDIAAAVLYCASDDSRNMTGQQVVVDGGWDV
jgi:3-oxoacyl-[acyl-carrier protein] reductase